MTVVEKTQLQRMHIHLCIQRLPLYFVLWCPAACSIHQQAAAGRPRCRRAVGWCINEMLMAELRPK